MKNGNTDETIVEYIYSMTLSARAHINYESCPITVLPLADIDKAEVVIDDDNFEIVTTENYEKYKDMFNGNF